MNDLMPQTEPVKPPAKHHLPNLLDAVVFFSLAGVVMLLVTVAVLGLALAMSRMPGSQPTTLVQLAKDPMVLMMAQAISYIVTLLIAALIFSEWWQMTFSAGIEWNWRAVRGRSLVYLFGGLMLGMTAYFASTWLTVPKSLPVDNYFQTAAAVWVIAIFGSTLGPLSEEIAFRGFLLPAFDTAAKWVAEKFGFESKDRSSNAAMVFSVVLTSILFTAMHAPQLANTLSVLCLLFVVSVVLTLIRIRARSVAASTLVHAGYNLWNFLLMFIVTGGFRHLDKLQH